MWGALDLTCKAANWHYCSRGERDQTHLESPILGFTEDVEFVSLKKLTWILSVSYELVTPLVNPSVDQSPDVHSCSGNWLMFLIFITLFRLFSNDSEVEHVTRDCAAWLRIRALKTQVSLTHRYAGYHKSFSGGRREQRSWSVSGFSIRSCKSLCRLKMRQHGPEFVYTQKNMQSFRLMSSIHF